MYLNYQKPKDCPPGGFLTRILDFLTGSSKSAEIIFYTLKKIFFNYYFNVNYFMILIFFITLIDNNIVK